ncbi:MAG: NADAR family protein [Mariprofundaceae bacterium]|nr:NADAR family protein [Mariprofundaceae bacterium]
MTPSQKATNIRTYNRLDSIVFLRTKEKFGGLSNMASGFPINVNGIHIASSEALYQSCRFPHEPDIQKLIMDEYNPMTSKMMSKRFNRETRPDWYHVRVNVMRWCLRVKLINNWDKFGRLLLLTESKFIVEQSRRDTFWGAEPTNDITLVGMNVLGRLLMELREELQSESWQSLLKINTPNIPNFLLLGKEVDVINSKKSEKPNIKSAVDYMSQTGLFR